MLQTIHDKITGWIAGLVIVLIGVPFVFWGVDIGLNAANYAAKVKVDQPFWKPATKIATEEVRRAFQNQLTQYQQIYRGEVPDAVRTELQNNLLEAYIRNELLTQHSWSLGYRVTDAEVLKSYEQVPQFQIDGKFSRELAQRILQSQGLSPAAFEADQRKNLQVTQLQNAIALSSFVTPAELEYERALQSEQREVAWLVIPAERYMKDSVPDEAAISAEYDKTKANFMTPDTVTLRYVELKVADEEAKVAVTEEALRGYYESVKDRYVGAEKRRGRHILIQVPSDKDEESARKKAEDLLAKAKAPGADFAALAKQYSQDAGSAQQGGDLGWAEKSYFVGPFADALFSMTKGEIRGPVRSQFGYHVIKLDDIQPGTQKTFEEARPELETEYRKQEAEKQFGDLQEKLADKAFESLDDLDKVASEMGLKVQEIPAFTRENGGGAFGNREEILEAAFSDDVLAGQNSRPIELEPGHVVVVRVANRRPPEQKPLDAVRAQISTQLQRERAGQHATKTGTDAVEKLSAGGATWPALVSSLDVKPEGPKSVTRAEPSLPVEIRNALFVMPKPAPGKPHYQGAALANGDYAVIAFTGTSSDSQAETADQLQQRRRQSSGRAGTGEVSAYIAELRARAKVITNPKVFE